MLSFLAAVSAPLRIRSQNESPGTSWVIIAIVARGVSAVPPPIPPPFCCGFPPVLEHDASKLITAAAAATVAAPRGRRRVDESGRQFVYFIAFLVFLWRREGRCGRRKYQPRRFRLSARCGQRGDMPA